MEQLFWDISYYGVWFVFYGMFVYRVWEELTLIEYRLYHYIKEYTTHE